MSKPITEYGFNDQQAKQGYEIRQLQRRPPVAAGGAGQLPINFTNPPIVGADVGHSFPFVQGLTGGDIGGWAFIKDVEAIIFGMVRVPIGFGTAGIVNLLFGSLGTGDAVMQVGAFGVAVASSYDPISFTVETPQTITVAAANTLEEASFSLTDPIVEGDLLFVEVAHLGDDGSDTLDDKLMLWGAWLDAP